ncbi:tripartite tricarboxylate transporter substrate binding protein [Roseomonas sp. JC162]|uniref:Tripartite tricarboxylate transporter substrate binding protein n=1 Tax=Neoroseomonas marina TaxID=1232220 RepID=A0A848EKJ0_9PROT|nr:tripartite tricarboxylate transporter substrate-binding protein [Neoroseomonas marina]NMJ44456.1 tripartite tricarboxylate transporter substrate binding protein [Neoroseomonas marina]
MQHPTTRRLILAGAGSLLAAPAIAQGWEPNRPLRIVVTYPPGGVNDIVARIVAEPLSRELEQPVVVENRAGAGGNIGTQHVIQSPPDGYTILLGTTALFGVNPIVYASSGIDAVRDTTSLGLLGQVANILSVIPGKVEATDLRSFIAEAKRRPMVYGSVGNGSSSHLSATVFMQMAGIEATHVPYRGSSPLVAAMLAKDVDFGFDTSATSTAHIRSGAFRPLAVTTTVRASALPEVPTMQEAGLPGYDLGIWFNLAVAKRTPAPAVARLREALGKAMSQNTVERLKAAFVDPIAVPVTENDAWIAASAGRWQQITRDARIAAD